VTSSRYCDVAVVGDGIVALCCARALARTGLKTTIIGRRMAGDASSAAAGILAPSIDPFPGAAGAFAQAARDRYPGFVAALAEETGVLVTLQLDGVLRVAGSPEDHDRLSGALDDWAYWLDPAAVAELEPGLHAPLGARWNRGDGFVDNVQLIAALDRWTEVMGTPRLRGHVAEVSRGEGSIRVVCEDGATVEAPRVVIATGAWSALLRGLPRRLPVAPLRGQMVALAGSVVRHAAFGEHGYVVPRGSDRTLVGTTSEPVGFDAGVTDEATESMRRFAGSLVPALSDAPVVARWSGLRPMTPDGLPLIGPDPEHPGVVYACGHSRNGILMAPLTADSVATYFTEGVLPQQLAVFSPARFMGESS
jgi:glycine oxidase